MLARIESQACLFLLGLALLILDRDGLDAQFLGPRGQVLVGDPQLLDGRGQLLVERLQLLVGRLEFLVEGLDLLAAGLGVLARAEHRRVGAAQVGDQRGQLVIGTQQTFVDRGGLLDALARPGVGGAVALDARDIGQLDDGSGHAGGTRPVRADRRLDTPRGVLGDVGRFHLVDR